jgi:predicted nucleic acid-binding protein
VGGVGALSIFGGTIGRGAVALDTNAVIAAVEQHMANQILKGRAPIVPVTAIKEFLRGGGSSEALRAFLTGTGGRIIAGTEATALSLRLTAPMLGRVIGIADSRVAAGAIDYGLRLITNDLRLGRFLGAVGHSVERF